MKQVHDIDNVSRLAGLIIERNPELAEKELGYEEAVSIIKKFTLCLVCGSRISESASLQAALLTSINTGKRAFQGGVSVIIKENTPLLLPWPGKKNLNEVVLELGGVEINQVDINYSFVLTFGLDAHSENSLQVVCNGWQGGVCAYNKKVNIENGPDFSLGGILAGSLAVGLAFLKATGEKPDVCYKNVGVSLWRPDFDWESKEAVGPDISVLPQKYWFLGLGHLGQAFIWTLGLLPFAKPSDVSVILQDYDIVSQSNLETGLLSEKENVGEKKTRVCSKWLSERNISTSLLEKKFSSGFVVEDGEPRILIRGLDSVKARREINLDVFDYVIDCGIGGTRSDFDFISIINLPTYGKPPKEIWEAGESTVINKANEKAMAFLGCGLYGKSISTSFVGALASALVFSELIRSGEQGIKTGAISLSIRNLTDEKSVIHTDKYSTELVANGYVEATNKNV